MSAVFVIDAMKSVTADALFVPGVRTRVDFGFVWQSAVKAGVKDGDLRCIRKQFGGEVDTFQTSLVVQRRDRSHVGDGLADLGRDACRFAQPGAPVNDAMPDCIYFGGTFKNGG